MITTLDCPDLRDQRACGNTTRQADFAIQSLFSHGKVKVIDHSEISEQSRRLAARVMERIHNELKLDYRGYDVDFDTKRLTIKLQKI